MSSDDTQHARTKLVVAGLNVQTPQDTPTWYTPDSHIGPSLASDDEAANDGSHNGLHKSASLQADSRGRHVERRSLHPPGRSATMPAPVTVPDAPREGGPTMPNPWGSSQEQLDVSAVIFPEPSAHDSNVPPPPSFPQPDHLLGTMKMPKPGVPAFPTPSHQPEFNDRSAPSMPLAPGDVPQFPSAPVHEPIAVPHVSIPNPESSGPAFPTSSPVGVKHLASTKLDPLPPLPQPQPDHGIAIDDLVNAHSPPPLLDSPEGPGFPLPGHPPSSTEDQPPQFPAHPPAMPNTPSSYVLPQHQNASSAPASPPSQPAPFQGHPMAEHVVPQKPTKISDTYTQPPAIPHSPPSKPPSAPSSTQEVKPSLLSSPTGPPSHNFNTNPGTAATGSKPPSKFDNYSQHQQQPPFKPTTSFTPTTSTPTPNYSSPAPPTKPEPVYHSAPQRPPVPSPAPVSTGSPTSLTPVSNNTFKPASKPPVTTSPPKPTPEIVEAPATAKPPTKPPPSTSAASTSPPHNKPPKPSPTPSQPPSKPQPAPTTSTPNLPTHTLSPDVENQHHRPHLLPSKSQMETQYVNMLLALDDIPPLHNMAAGFFTWILLAGFILFPGTFNSLENLGANGTVDPRVVNAVKHVPLFVIAWICTGIGIAGMIYCTYRWHRNYIWCLNKIFLPGFMNSLAGLLSTLANVFGVQHGDLVTTSRATLIVTTVATGVTGILTLIYSLWLVRRVKAKHDAQVGEQKTGKFGEGVVDLSTVKRKKM